MPPLQQAGVANVDLDKRTRLAVGDVVSVAVGAFGEEYARARNAVPWRSEAVRDEGVVVGRRNSLWVVKFADGAQHEFERKALSYVERPADVRQQVGRRRATARDVTAEEGSDEEDARQPQAPVLDSSEEDEGIGEADHEGANGVGNDVRPRSDWVRDDSYGIDERARHGFTDRSGPRLNGLNDWEKASLFSLGCHFLPMSFLEVMAAEMQQQGAEKYAAGQRAYVGWRVNRDDLLQWIGVWLYMLAFPQAGERRAYWTEPSGGYGPRHRLSSALRLGQNGDKGLLWFEMMCACFILPVHPGTTGDPFQRTRRWWDELRDSFHAAIVCSWLVVLDESMIRWMGLGMPGLMVVLRKPTPIGLELHTLCCAICGVLAWFEVYEGKEAMAKKEFCDRYPKSVALTLRMLKPFFSTGRVVIADSWFGSVACALALFAHGLFAVMNVKTATREYPKAELMAVVDEIKGKSTEARAARRARRGKQIAFIRSFEIGSRIVTLTAGGHNKKIPLLLIATYGSMLPGEEHVKVWQSNLPDGTIQYNRITTAQPQIHALYRKWMNVVDVHNKLRQGVVSMADVWRTRNWAERHFAEGLGMWEVNVFKALIYFYSGFKNLSHGEFRMRLAWAFLTLGKVGYPKDMLAAGEAGSSTDFPAATSDIEAPLPGGTHLYVRHPKESPLHRCAYCGKPSYYKCATCEATGLGTISVCGPRASAKRECRKKHADGMKLKHSTFKMSMQGRHNVQASVSKRVRDGNLDHTDDEEED